MPRRATPLVGRAGELAQLEQLLAGSTERGAIVSGDAGVGKTRLLAEVLDRAERASIRCLAGHCLDFGEASLPYLPFSEAFGRLAETDPALVEQLLTRFGPIGRLLPPGPGSALSRSGEDPARLDRAGLYDSVQSGLEAIAEDQPVLLLIEDVHWADQATRDLIGFLLARLRSNRLSLLVSYRTDDLHRRHPLRRALAEWSRLPRVRRVHLDPLSATEVRSLVTAIRPSGLSEDELGRIVERAAGNAFYAEELASAAGQDRQAGAGDGLPGELAELLLIRLDRLSELAGELVRLAAVAGGRIGHEQLVELADRPDRPDRAGAAAELEAALREAVDEHVLEPVDIGYTFRHALLSEAVYDDLLPGERVRLHAAFARLLAGQPGSANAAQLARHARRSNDLAGAFAASILAGEQAMDLAAPQEAMRHFETALELLGSVPAPADRDWTQLVLAAADAAGDAGHPYRALAIVRDALERPPVGLADLDHARLLLGLANRSLLVDADNDAAAATTAALQLVPAQPPSQLRARLAALHAHASVALGRDVDGARWAQEAIELSGQLGQPEAAADARTTLGLIERRSGDPDAAAQQLRAVAEQAQAGGELTIELRSRYTLATLHHEQGQLPAALVAFQTAANRARETGRQWAAYGIEARALAGMVQYELGDWDGALRTVDVAGQAAPATAAGLLTAVGLAVRAGRGETEALSLLPMLRQRWQSEGLVGALAAGPAIELLAGTGDSAGALALLDEHLECQTRLWQNEWFLGRIRISALGLATLSVQAATSPTEQRAAIAERGAELADAGRLSASRGLPAGRRLGIEAVGWLARLEAEAARLRWLTGVQPPALADHIELWQASVAGFGYGHGYEQARSRTRLAELLRAAGKAEEAAAQAELARTLGRRLGAEPLLAELRRLGTSPNRRGGDGASGAELTPRERDVLALLVQGRTNRQVARQLYISEKTVSVHVSNLLAKLGVRSRAEAAVLARRDGLLDG